MKIKFKPDELDEIKRIIVIVVADMHGNTWINNPELW